MKKTVIKTARAFCFSAVAAVLLAGCVTGGKEPRMLDIEQRPSTHDPAMIKENDTYYLFCTGGNIPILTSTNMVEWTREGTVFDSLPEWVKEELPRTEEAWAPDISFFNGRYHLYYSLSSFGVNESAIGLAVNRTLDPESPDYKWEDRGMVIRSRPGETDFNAIDPNIIVIDEDNVWLSWGSFWGGIMIRKIDPVTGKASREDASVYAIASRPRELEHRTPPTEGAIEAPFIIQRDGYFYLFASYDFCCRGVNSTYNIRVGRSKNITGPYLDKDGISMRDGGGSMVLQATTPNWKGPGHEAIFSEDGQDYLVFHAYDGNNGRVRLHISTLVWEKGWPRAALLP
ncbi:MAG: family 43 glycosylhydrolase [Pontiellaceae bacterium]|nr:family 43 glycosylhydrolase [Pontiellaceae bacterium]